MSHDLLAMAFDNSPRRSDAEQNQTIMNRAIEIGMDPFKDTKLFWIAEQSLKAKLPDEWMECQADDGQIYYFNLRNEDSTWEHPTLEHYRQLYAKVKKQQEVEAKAIKRGNSSLLPDIEPNSSRTDKISPRGVAASSLKKKRDAEKLGGDATFWRTRYDLVESERDKIESQARKLEKELQENLLQGARLIESNHKLKTLSEDCGGKLRVASNKIIKHLAKRGFRIDPRKGTGDVDLLSSTNDLVAVVDAHVEVDEGDRDENGYSLNWDGALARMKKELEFCFTYEEGESYTVDENELKVKLLDMVAMVISFGEYLQQGNRDDYIERFIDHIVDGASGSTMVPLEVLSRAGMRQRDDAIGRPDILLDPPHLVSNLRKDLENERVLTKQLGAEIDQKKHELEVMHTKLLGMQARLEDNRSHEELMTTKFNSLVKSLEDFKLTGGSGSAKGGDVVGLSSENDKLKKEVKSLNGQLNIANKRAVDAERRLEDAVEKESEMKSEITRLELNLRLKIDKKKSLIQELAEQKSDLEKVSKELYDELQNALLVSERIESDNEAMKDLLDEYRAGDASVAVVREKLEIEYERNKTLEDKIEDLQKDLDTVEKAYREVMKINEKLELEAMEMREEMAGMTYELNRQRNRTDVLTHDNLQMEEVSRNLKNHIVKLNDQIVEIKGSIRVFCRVRPLFVDEINGLNISEADLESLVRYPDYNILDFNSCPFEFDRVFEPCIGQEDIYEEVDPYVRSVMNGCRACIFAYGETGSGKTHTMEGASEDPGVVQRALRSIFHESKASSEFKTEISLAMVEVYNEGIKDLLSLVASEDPLEVRVGRNGTYVDGLSEWPARCVEEAISLMNRAASNRAVGHADPEEHYTRSHLVHLVKVERLNVRNGQTLLGYLYMVDLAGSERVQLSSMTGKRLREAQTINKSLGSLGDVISSLAANHKHIPYRSSKLTFLLQDALKKSSKVLMFVNINPSPVHTGESTNALQFASHCRNVELGVAKRAVTYAVKPE